MQARGEGVNKSKILGTSYLVAPLLSLEVRGPTHVENIGHGSWTTMQVGIGEDSLLSGLSSFLLLHLLLRGEELSC